MTSNVKEIDGILVNEEIPRTMTMEGLIFLGKLARHVPENGIIVEVGPLYGSSTWVLAKNAHPSVKVYSIDTWEPAEWIDEVAKKKFPHARKFGREAFEYYVRDCDNVVPIQGWSPDVVRETWDKPIDLFFDDASHGNPGFINNLTFFEPFVKPGCVLCGDDYASGCPDIVHEIDKLAAGWGQQVTILGRVWALRKPRNTAAPEQTSVYRALTPREEPFPVIEAHNFGGVTRNDYPFAWSGRLHRYDPLRRFVFFWTGGHIPGLELEAQCRGMNGKQSEWKKAGEWVEPPTPDTPIASVRFRLTGERAKDYSLQYQVGYCYPRIGRKVGAHNSRFFLNNSWTDQADPEHPLPLNAIRLQLQRKKD